MRRPVCGRRVRRRGGGYLTEADIDICQSQRISGLLGSNEAHLHRQWRQSVLINILSASKSQGRWIFEPTFTGIFIAEVESGLQAVKGNHPPGADSVPPVFRTKNCSEKLIEPIPADHGAQLDTSMIWIIYPGNQEFQNIRLWKCRRIGLSFIVEQPLPCRQDLDAQPVTGDAGFLTQIQQQ